MWHEISQFDIPNRQLLAKNAQSRMGMWMDIGEAKITHTIFGKAKVRVIREQDKNRRAWLLTALSVTALAAAAWQGWIALQQTELLQSAAPPLPLSERIRISAPDSHPANILISAIPPSISSKPGTPSQTEINNPATNRKSAPQQAPGLQAAGPMAAKPVTAQPLTASKPLTAKPQATPLAAHNNSPKNQTDLQQPPILSAPIQPTAPTDATPPATQPAANTPPAEPLIEGDTSTLSAAGGNQPPGTVSTLP